LVQALASIESGLAVSRGRKCETNRCTPRLQGDIFAIRILKGAGEVSIVSYEKALEILSRDDRFKATIYAMNTLLIHKGIYTQQEFQQLFVEWAFKEESKKGSQMVRRTTEVSA